MENEFVKTMSERTNKELVSIVTVERENYNPTAITAADAEVAKRNIDTTTFQEIKEKASSEKKQLQKTDANVVNSGIRFLNFIIDLMAVSIVFILLGYIIGIFIGNDYLDLFQIVLPLMYFIIFLGYYAFMELRFQKTLGKFVTKTKVVKMDGSLPDNGDILARTFCRLIPFDRLSFLFVKNGIHDFLSKTKVIKDTVDENLETN
ncbi:MAG: hypothetical protein COA50_07955 [Flavobacteriaceae bacterium]|nr:MAG: hypothetical protein COA50_07955 [Flavobacteriaceae bacterium]